MMDRHGMGSGGMVMVLVLVLVILGIATVIKYLSN